MIPKIIWQTHNYLYEDMPDHIKKCMKTWINLNPGWTHNYVNHIDREAFVKSRSEKLYKLYLISHPVSQSDIWRLLVLYEFGGVYADMDSICVKPLDYMFQQYSGQEFVAGKVTDSGLFHIGNFAAIEKSSIMLKMIESATNDVINNLYWHTNLAFNKHMCASLTDADQFFDAESHSKDYKDNFIELEVDYYGEKMSYREYLKNKINLSEEEYLASINV